MDTIFITSQFRRTGSETIKGEIMKKEMTLETNDETVDLSRRSMMGRFGLMASIACAAPVLMTLSTSAQAKHKVNNDNDNGKGSCKADAAAGMKCPPDGQFPPETNDSGW